MEDILAVVIGGLISAGTTIICFIWEHRHYKRAEQEKIRLEQKQWKREHTLEVFLNIASALERIVIPVDEKTGIVVNEEYKNYLLELQSVIENNRGKLVLFAPHEISNKLFEFQAKLYKLSTIPGKKISDYESFTGSSIVEIMKDAWMIEDLLKKEMFE